MARFWLKMPHSVVVVVVVVMVMVSLMMSGVHGLAGTEVACEPCVKSRCPELHYCEGEAVMDHCGCCQVCSSSKFQPHLRRPYGSASSSDSNLLDDHDEDGGPKGRACDNVQCPKLKICRENMQGLPLCTCPGPYLCRQRRSRQKPVCGTDGLTYDSRCYLRIAACNAGTRIKVARKGPCNGSEASRCESPRSCRKRKRQSVCGTDGRSYPSRCQMKIAACRKGVKVKVNHPGVCSSGGGGGGDSASAAAAAAVVGSGGVDVAGRVGLGSMSGLGSGSVAPFIPHSTSSVPTSSRHHPSDQPPPREAAGNGNGRKGRRRNNKKKNGGSIVNGGDEEEDGKRKRRKQAGRREKRKNRNKRRRKRRKTRQYHRQRRGGYGGGAESRQMMRNLGLRSWRKV